MGRCEAVAEGTYGDFSADVRLNAGFLCHGVEARYTIEAVAVGKGYGGHF
jgi:hypothetical protein